MVFIPGHLPRHASSPSLPRTIPPGIHLRVLPCLRTCWAGRAVDGGRLCTVVLLLNCLAFAILPTTSDGEDRAPTRPGGGSPESLGDSPRAAVSRASIPPTSSASLPAPILSTSLPAPHLLYRDTHHNSPQHGWPPGRTAGKLVPPRVLGAWGESGLPTSRGGFMSRMGQIPGNPRRKRCPWSLSV